MKKIYIVYSQTNTVFAKIIKKITHKEYSHISLSLDKEGREMYSFGRRKPTNPFIGGFVKENLNDGLFKIQKNVRIKIFEIVVTEKEYHKIIHILDDFKKNKEKYGYNFLGVLLVLFKTKKQRINKYYCAEFVYHVLSNKKVHLVKKIDKPITIYDVNNCQRFNTIYEGDLQSYLNQTISI